MLLGEPNIGKTPIAVILVMAFSRHYVRLLGRGAPCYRTASDLDFFRGEPGRVDRPDIFDDGDQNRQRPANLKAFYDMSLKEAMSYERWGAAKWVRNQLRIGLDNKWDTAIEELVMTRNPEAPLMTYEEFMDMIKPALPKNISQADAAAVVKRTSVVVNGKKRVWVKLAKETRVMCKVRSRVQHLYSST